MFIIKPKTTSFFEVVLKVLTTILNEKKELITFLIFDIITYMLYFVKIYIGQITLDIIYNIRNR